MMNEASNSHEEQCIGIRTLTVEELAYCTGTTRVVIRQLVEEDLIQSVAKDGQEVFDSDSFLLIRKMLRLHRHLGIDFQSLGLVMDLLDRIDELEKR